MVFWTGLLSIPDVPVMTIMGWCTKHFLFPLSAALSPAKIAPSLVKPKSSGGNDISTECD